METLKPPFQRQHPNIGQTLCAGYQQSTPVDWAGGDEYRQLDYLMVSDSLARGHRGVKPIIW